MGAYNPQPDLERMIGALAARVAVLERRQPEPTRYVGTAGQPGFLNSWVNLDASPAPIGRAAGFYRHDGRVYLTGVIKSGAAATTAFVLPAGYRPAVATDDAHTIPVSAAADVAVIAVEVDGSVIPLNRGASNVTTFCFLDLSFRHA